MLPVKMGKLLYAIKPPRSRISESSSSSSHCNILGTEGMKVVRFKVLHYFDNLDLTFYDLFLNPVYVDNLYLMTVSLKQKTKKKPSQRPLGPNRRTSSTGFIKPGAEFSVPPTGYTKVFSEILLLDFHLPDSFFANYDAAFTL